MVIEPMADFDDIPETRIFEDYSVLKGEGSPDGEPINQQTVRSAFRSVVDLLRKRKVPPVLFLYGPAGSGKTYLARHCFEWRKPPYTTTKEILTVRIKRFTPTKTGNALRLLCRCFDDQLPAPDGAPRLRCKPSQSVVREQIGKRLQTLSFPVVVIFDEFTLTEPVQSIIRDVLLPLRSETTKIPIGLIFLSYKDQYEELTDCFDEGGPVHLELDRYSHEEMTRILSQRAADAFQPGVVSNSVLELCAKIAIERKATPQGALELLLRAGAEASLTGESTVSKRHVQKGVAEMDSTTWN